MIDKCNNYQKLCIAEKRISALLKIIQDESLLQNLSITKQESSKEKAEIYSNQTPNVLILENNNENEETKNIKNNIKLKLNILMSVIAHKMDPVERAGETAESNKKDAKNFGRSKKDSSSLTIALLKTILNQIKLILEVAITNQKIEDYKDMNMNIEQQQPYLPNLEIQKDNQQGRSR
ncbi:hypothetical protein [Ehrlichia japonica]|uniref:Uncharacterized protein n=1 Tax=Ehrlichia japonica TaxID=391036 RepID=X5H2A5_9RICK|nr:hypothetical protein [Ehrlichia japonica]AHX04220.1 hypothetical protein EHF_0591 [Ehrlichia japonica]